ncbi:MAG: hypothetical protein AAF330_01600 [Pseudomonadota bacterium]
MTILTTNTSFLRHDSPLTREEWIEQTKAWLSEQSTEGNAKLALSLDLKNPECLLSIVFSPEAMAARNIPEDMATIDVIQIIVALLERRQQTQHQPAADAYLRGN